MLNRKYWFVLSVLLIIVLIAGCAPKEPTSAPAETQAAVVEEAPTQEPVDDGKSVGFSTITLASDFMAMMAGQFEKAFTEAGYEWNIGIADGDPKAQIDQIENFITLGVDVIVVLPVDPTALSDVLAQAHNEGIKIIAFTVDTEYSDVYVGGDNTAIGTAAAEMANEWIETTYSDAGAGEVQVAIIDFRTKPEAIERSDALASVADNEKVNIVDIIQVPLDTEAEGQAAAESLFLTNPDIDVVISYNSAIALGVNTYVMSPSSPVTDVSKFAIFGTDMSEQAAAEIRASGKNESALRGVTQLGGDIFAVFASVVDYSNRLLAGEDVPNDYAPVYKITVDNVEEVIAQQYPSLNE